jgi:hypothetical protein
MRILPALLILLWAGLANAQVPICNQWAFASVAPSTQLVVAGQAGKVISICGVVFSSAGAGTGQIVAGTGGTCATSQSTISMIWNIAANSPTGVSNSTPTVAIPQGNNLCAIITGSTTNVQIIYGQY